MKIINNNGAAGSRYETPAITTVNVASEGVLCVSGEESNAFIEDFNDDTPWTW